MTLFRDRVSLWLNKELFMKKTVPSVEKIWATLEKASEKLNRISAEVGDLKQSSAKVDEQIRLLSKETKKTSKGLREDKELFTSQSSRSGASSYGLREARNFCTSPWERLIDNLAGGDLAVLLKEKNIDVEATVTKIEGKNLAVDILAVNRTEVVVVEVKTSLKVKDVSHFAKKLEIFTNWRTEYKGKKIYGAVAYIRANKHSTKKAEKQGLFVIRATGSSATIINQENFKPKTYY